MTYQEAAAALRMTPESVRARARREHWRKQLGNEGKALILVPVDAGGIPASDDAVDTPVSRPVKQPEPDPVHTALQARISELASRMIELKADVERERGERLQERERAERLTDEVANLARQLANTVAAASSQERSLQDHLGEAKAKAMASTAEAEAARAALNAWKARPWYRRLVG